ncbi:spondin-1-like [Tropilaelaps mercedesae]|uniref:Spondin-1-like n=1 Tax=Tropilaelaps mercedesae TaxID=418985 RepID=A0A1V9Y1N8_9ACAR|nr:spondin-1-like [Tropilaelaps mercedesae]
MTNIVRDKDATSGFISPAKTGSYVGKQLCWPVVVVLAAVLLTSSQKQIVAGATPTRTSTVRRASSLTGVLSEPQARPLVTLSSGEYDNTDGREVTGRRHGHNDDGEDTTSGDRSFSLEDCARLLTSSAPPDAGVSGHRTLGGGGFAIRIAGTPNKYMHGESYTVSLQAPPDRVGSPPRRFIGFTLSLGAVPDDHHKPRHRGASGSGLQRSSSYRKYSGEHSRKPHDIVGIFQTFGDALSRLLSDECNHVVSAASSIPKAEELCPEEREDEDVQPPLLAECCACDEAKYELTFEGLWSRRTHPVGYPDSKKCRCIQYTFCISHTIHGIFEKLNLYLAIADKWLTHFSDIIGASHAADFRMWQYGGPASDGVRNVAEHGTTSRLEAELKAQSAKIRTIIKARGLWYPAAADGGRTFAVFRVDRRHHVVSALSALGPPPSHTPAWLVGVSALELCLRNCSWATSKTMNLYPWHSTTVSAGDAQETSHSFVTLHRSASGARYLIRPVEASGPPPLKPVARLTITRQRLYEKVSCDPDAVERSSSLATKEGRGSSGNTSHSGTDENGGSFCEGIFGPWGTWGPCAASCGSTGLRYRARSLLVPPDDDRIAACALPEGVTDVKAQLEESEQCENACANGISCETTAWSEWTECAATCGKGIRARRRKYLASQHMARKVCSVDLVERDPCEAPHDIHCAPENISWECAVSEWSEWSPCTASCGAEGVRFRTRAHLRPQLAVLARCAVHQLHKTTCRSEQTECGDDDRKAQEVCFLPSEPGPCRGAFHRFYYDIRLGKCMKFIWGGCRGNRNRFETFAECKTKCGRALEVLRSSHQLPVPTTSSHAWHFGDSGRRVSGSRIDLVHAGIPPENSMFKPPLAVSPNDPNGSDESIRTPVDCVVTRWSEWSPCNKTCGNGRRSRRRMVKTNARRGGRPCPPKLVQRRRCHNNPPCAENVHTHQEHNAHLAAGAGTVNAANDSTGIVV